MRAELKKMQKSNYGTDEHSRIVLKSSGHPCGAKHPVCRDK
jgi:hypothetical protein